MTVHIVLVEPEIPANTGNIARTCAATCTPLHLVEPLGFSLADRYMRRAGLDYWPSVDLRLHDSFAAFASLHHGQRMFFATTKGSIRYTEVTYAPGDMLVFGKETAGLPETLLSQHPDACIRLPMSEAVRSLNLANSVAVMLYEALRQLSFPQLH